MKPDRAKRLAKRALRLSEDLNKMVREIEANEPDQDSLRLRQAIGRVMWAIYYDILMPTLEEHPSVEHKVGAEAGAATKTGPRPWGTRSAAQPARPSAPTSRRPPERQRSARRRLRFRQSDPPGHKEHLDGCQEITIEGKSRSPNHHSRLPAPRSRRRNGR